MKKVTKLAMFLLAGTLATGFVSCSSDDDEVINTTILTPEQQSALSQAESESRAKLTRQRWVGLLPTTLMKLLNLHI